MKGLGFPFLYLQEPWHWWGWQRCQCPLTNLSGNRECLQRKENCLLGQHFSEVRSEMGEKWSQSPSKRAQPKARKQKPKVSPRPWPVWGSGSKTREPWGRRVPGRNELPPWRQEPEELGWRRTSKLCTGGETILSTQWGQSNSGTISGWWIKKSLMFAQEWNKTSWSVDPILVSVYVGAGLCSYACLPGPLQCWPPQTHLHLQQAAPARQRLRPSQRPTWSLIWGYVSSEKHLCAGPSSPGYYCKNTLQNKLITNEALIWLSYQFLTLCTQLGKLFPLTLYHKFKFCNSPLEVNRVTLFHYKRWIQKNRVHSVFQVGGALYRALLFQKSDFSDREYEQEITQHTNSLALDEKVISNYTKIVNYLTFFKHKQSPQNNNLFISY